MNLYFNVVFHFRALQDVLGWKLSVLMVTHITITQRLEVDYVFIHFHPILVTIQSTYFLCSLVIHGDAFWQSHAMSFLLQSRAGKSQQTFL